MPVYARRAGCEASSAIPRHFLLPPFPFGAWARTEPATSVVGGTSSPRLRRFSAARRAIVARSTLPFRVVMRPTQTFSAMDRSGRRGPRRSSARPAAFGLALRRSGSPSYPPVIDLTSMISIDDCGI